MNNDVCVIILPSESGRRTSRSFARGAAKYGKVCNVSYGFPAERATSVIQSAMLDINITTYVIVPDCEGDPDFIADMINMRRDGTVTCLAGCRNTGDGKVIEYNRTWHSVLSRDDDNRRNEIHRIKSVHMVFGRDVFDRIGIDMCMYRLAPEAMTELCISTGVKIEIGDPPSSWFPYPASRVSSVRKAKNDELSPVCTGCTKSYDINNPDELPVVTVMMTTWNRTSTALFCIRKLVEHLKYPKLKWCICDDRSEPGHIEYIQKQFDALGVEVKIIVNTEERHGLGASMNNGMDYAFSNGDVALTTEDDWVLEKDLYIEPFVKFLCENPRAAAVRMGVMFTYNNIQLVDTACSWLKKLVPVNKNPWMYNNQVALRHRRVIGILGRYDENVHSDKSETAMKDKYNNNNDKLDLYWPSGWATNTFDSYNLPFIHIGSSTVGHGCKTPERYKSVINASPDTMLAPVRIQHRSGNHNSSGYAYRDATSGRILVSLTSIPSRILQAGAVVNSLVNQTRKPDKIVMYLSRNQFLSENMPEKHVERMFTDKCNFEIRWKDEDLKSYKKYIYALSEFNGYDIITADDDIIYSDRFIERLIDASARHPGCVAGNCAFSRKKFNGTTLSEPGGVKWIFRSPESYYISLGTGGGLMIPAGLTDKLDCYNRDFINILPTDDEMWLWHLFFKAGIKCVCDSKISKAEDIGYLISNKECLRNINCNSDNRRNMLSSLAKYMHDTLEVTKHEDDPWYM